MFKTDLLFLLLTWCSLILSRRSHSGTYSSHSSHSPSPRQHKGRRASPVTQLRTDRDRQSESSRHSNKRRRSRSRTRSTSRERARDRDYVKHKHDRTSHHWDHRERERERERSRDHGRSKHQSRSHSGHSRHRKWGARPALLNEMEGTVMALDNRTKYLLKKCLLQHKVFPELTLLRSGCSLDIIVVASLTDSYRVKQGSGAFLCIVFYL